MLEKIAESITDYLIRRGDIKAEDKEIYAFGFEMGGAMLGNLITSILIGIALGMLVESIVFLLAYLPLRSYAGGFHASNHLKCYFLSTGIILAVLLAIRNVSSLNVANESLMLVACSAIIIFISSPVQDGNKPLDADERKVYAKRSKIILFIEVLFYLLFLFLGKQRMALIIATSLVIMAITLFIGYSKNESDTDYV